MRRCSRGRWQPAPRRSLAHGLRCTLTYTLPYYTMPYYAYHSCLPSCWCYCNPFEATASHNTAMTFKTFALARHCCCKTRMRGFHQHRPCCDAFGIIVRVSAFFFLSCPAVTCWRNTRTKSAAGLSEHAQSDLLNTTYCMPFEDCKTRRAAPRRCLSCGVEYTRSIKS